MKESEGTFENNWKDSIIKCPKCGGDVQYRMWESSCGGYEDAKFKCKKCSYIWWVDGSDS
jgi:transposase-like protein